jgi:hypothetical protein
MTKQNPAEHIESLGEHNSKKAYAKILLGFLSISLAFLIFISFFLSMKSGLLSNFKLKTFLNSKSNNSKGVASYDYIPNTFYDLDGWEVRYIQPIIISIESNNEANYLVLDLDGIKIRGFVSGFLNGSNVNEVRFKPLDKKGENIKFDDLGSRLDIGKRYKLSYFTKVPEQDLRDFEFCQNRVNLCSASEIFESVESDLKFDINGNVIPSKNMVLPIVEISEELLDTSEL